MDRGIYFKKAKISVFSVVADECTDITAVEELSVFCYWEEDGTPVECFLNIVPLKKADTESLSLATFQRGDAPEWCCIVVVFASPNWSQFLSQTEFTMKRYSSKNVLIF